MTALLPEGVRRGTFRGEGFPSPAEAERQETLVSGAGVRIERILSSGHVSPPGEWYDQTGDEWVLLLEGEATIAFEGGMHCTLRGGEWVFLPAHVRHRVESTSARPGCVWLAVHITPVVRS